MGITDKVPITDDGNSCSGTSVKTAPPQLLFGWGSNLMENSHSDPFTHT